MVVFGEEWGLVMAKSGVKYRNQGTFEDIEKTANYLDEHVWTNTAKCLLLGGM